MLSSFYHHSRKHAFVYRGFASSMQPQTLDFAPWKLQAAKQMLNGLDKSNALSEDNPIAMVWHKEGIHDAVNELRDLMPHATHTFAIKANPLLGVLQTLREANLGFESASRGELTQALRVAPPSDIMFDSPVKTNSDLLFALQQKVNINLDNLLELEVVLELFAADSSLLPAYLEAGAQMGVRVNPEVGAGTIAEYSTSRTTSKFGLGLIQYRQAIVDAYQQHKFLTMILCHAGSQGIPLDMIAQAQRATMDLVLEINAKTNDQVTTVDIGGGIPVNFSTEHHSPLFSEYVHELQTLVPELFTSQFKVVTEHGRRYSAKQGILLSRVEYVKDAGGRQILLQHSGMDILTRTVYMPETWPVRVTILDPDGNVKNSKDVFDSDVAGPCCIAADIVAHERALPRVKRGDYVMVHDVGGYQHSGFSLYNSRQAPSCHMFTEKAQTMSLMKARTSVNDTLRHYSP